MTQPPDQPPASGGHSVQIPVRWGDMDTLGHVNNAVYLTYLESARIAYFEALKIPVIRLGEEGILLVAASVNYRRQMSYPGTVSVRANVTAMSRRSITHGYVLRDAADGAVIADGSTVVVWADYRAAKSRPLPEPLVEAILALEGRPELRPPQA